jgi:hypothetical protein
MDPFPVCNSLCIIVTIIFKGKMYNLLEGLCHPLLLFKLLHKLISPFIFFSDWAGPQLWRSPSDVDHKFVPRGSEGDQCADFIQ